MLDLAEKSLNTKRLLRLRARQSLMVRTYGEIGPLEPVAPFDATMGDGEFTLLCGVKLLCCGRLVRLRGDTPPID